MKILPVLQVPVMMWNSPDGCCIHPSLGIMHLKNSSLLWRAMNLPELCPRGRKVPKAVSYLHIFDNTVSAFYLKSGQKWQRTMENYLSTMTPLKVFFSLGLLSSLVYNFQAIIREWFFWKKDSESQRDKHKTSLVRVLFFRFTKDLFIKGIIGIFIASQH